jgi:enoyl-CoA hydratase
MTAEQPVADGMVDDATAADGTGEDPGSVTIVEQDDVAWVTLTNPGRLNAFTWRMYDELEGLPGYLRQRPAIRAVVLQGSGGAFAAGTDISQFTRFSTPEQGLAYEHRVAAVLQGLIDLAIPTIAVVSGPAVGAGLAVAASCDIVLATPDAVFGAPIARTLGNCLPAAVVARLHARLGVGRTTAMLLTATLLPAGDAAVAGFVHKVLAPEGLSDELARLLKRVRTGAPLTLAALKETSRRVEAAAPPVDSDDLLRSCYGSEDFREGVAAFLEHRHPIWKGR